VLKASFSPSHISHTTSPPPRAQRMASNPKFNAKSLHFEKQEPAFLRKLRGEAADRGDSDRHEVQQARPGKKARLEMDDDDGPTVVFEDEAGFSSGGNVGREEYEMLMKGKAKGTDEGAGKSDEGRVEGQEESARAGEDVESVGGDGEEREKQKVAEVGGMKKRKVGKVVAGEGEEPEAGTTTSVAANRTAGSAKPQVKSKAKANKKKVKLSFDEPDS
jgi:hypothetical protein